MEPSKDGLRIIEELESEVRSYCRHFPVIFERARGAELCDTDGRSYLDFFAGAGALNYGHNPPEVKRALLDYLATDGIVHSLDLATRPKIDFLKQFQQIILKPRSLEYKVQFSGPTGANAVEAALKIARKATGRHNVLYFSNSFHGMTLGALAVTASGDSRRGGGVPLYGAHPVAYDGYFGAKVDTLYLLEKLLDDPDSGLDLPAAIIVECVQAEGGVNVASETWLRGLRELTKQRGIVLIVDEIQVGCGRTGTFFSFEPARILPDLVVLSKSLSGLGLPLSMVLIRPELDVLSPGEHNGTFRGHNLAFVTALAALAYFRDRRFCDAVVDKGARVKARLRSIAGLFPGAQVRGRGLLWGLDVGPGAAKALSSEAFRRGVIAETSGPRSGVLKLMPPLNIADDQLQAGLDRIEQSAKVVAMSHSLDKDETVLSSSGLHYASVKLAGRRESVASSPQSSDFNP